MPEEQIGPTGQFPDGKLRADDEGELAMRVSSGQGLVVVEFGKSISWLGLRPGDARDLAAVLLKHAEAAGPFVIEVHSGSQHMEDK